MPLSTATLVSPGLAAGAEASVEVCPVCDPECLWTPLAAVVEPDCVALLVPELPPVTDRTTTTSTATASTPPTISAVARAGERLAGAVAELARRGGGVVTPVGTARRGGVAGAGGRRGVAGGGGVTPGVALGGLDALGGPDALGGLDALPAAAVAAAVAGAGPGAVDFAALGAVA